MKTLSMQRLFAVILVLKIASSVAGWLLQASPYLFWSLGLAVPLGLMALYVWLGMTRRDAQLSEEKFADSCYYLGFIFTITSIILSLLDLPQMEGRLQALAVRFGAAMVSTVVGLGVRVYLVNFRPDAQDALRSVEESIIDAANAFNARLGLAIDKLDAFHADVDAATRTVVTRSRLAIEATSSAHGEQAKLLAAMIAAELKGLAQEVSAEAAKAAEKLEGLAEASVVANQKRLRQLDGAVAELVDRIAVRLEGAPLPARAAADGGDELARERERTELLREQAALLRELNAGVTRLVALLDQRSRDAAAAR